MFTTLVLKELRSVILGPKFIATFIVTSILMLLSVYLGIREFQSAERQYGEATALVQQEMREARQWMSVNDRVYRRPNPLQIVSAGVDNDLGRFSRISVWSPVKLVRSAYSDDPIFAMFRFLDLSFIVLVVLTLLAILYTYDAVNGERERGTLQLIFSHAVPRVQFIAAKTLGIWLGLVLPLSLTWLVSLLMIVVAGVPLTIDDGVRLAGFSLLSLLLVTFFIAYGILVSALTKRSSISFLIALVSWVAFTLIVPRTGMLLAAQMIQVPTVAEIESQQDSFEKDAWSAHIKEVSAIWKRREESMKGLTQEQRAAAHKENEWAWAEEDDAARKKVQTLIEANATQLAEGVRNRRQEQERLAYAIARISPISAYQLGVMDLAGTDISLKARYEDALNRYRTIFNAYKQQKQTASGGMGGIRISFDTNSGIRIDAGREVALDLSDRPQFEMVKASFADAMSTASTEFAVLAFGILLAVAGAFVAFIRYDVR